MNQEVETLRGICRVLILRILEANAVRELLHDEILKETRKFVPDIVEKLCVSHRQNIPRFTTQNVEPMKIPDLDGFQAFISTCDTSDLIRLAEVSRFVMEREVHAIVGKIIEKQS